MVKCSLHCTRVNKSNVRQKILGTTLPNPNREPFRNGEKLQYHHKGLRTTINNWNNKKE